MIAETVDGKWLLEIEAIAAEWLIVPERMPNG